MRVTEQRATPVSALMGFVAGRHQVSKFQRGPKRDSTSGFTRALGRLPTLSKRSVGRNGLDSGEGLAVSTPVQGAATCSPWGWKEGENRGARLDSCSQPEAQRAEIVICTLDVTGEGKRATQEGRKAHRRRGGWGCGFPGMEAGGPYRAAARPLLDTAPSCH